MLAPLLVSSTYSFHYGVLSPRELARQAKALGHEAIALTDRNGIYGLPSFVEACETEGLKALFGSELLYPGGRALVLVEDEAGFSRLARLLSDPDIRQESLRDSLLKSGEGLSIISDDPVLLAAGRGRAGLYSLALPSNRRDWKSLAASGAPLLATGEVRFGSEADRGLQRLLLAIGQNKTVGEIADCELGPPGSVLASPGQLRSIYADIPSALGENEALVQRIGKTGLFGGFVFPSYKGITDPAESARLLRQQVLEGARRRYESLGEELVARIDRELGIIAEKGFSDYFLVVRDIARLASRTCGRGSAAASVVSYCLGITDVDPVKHNLYFDRFLNPGRKDPPDIDVDFAWDERDAILARVIEDYGSDKATRVSNHICFQRRSALRETARAYGMPDGETSALERAMSIDEAKALAETDEVWREIVQLASRIVGFPRHLGVHSGGVVIVPDSLSSRLPLERTGSGIRVAVWDKEGVEAAGLVKIDLLGNRSLAVVRDALANLKEEGIELDPYRWQPIEDQETIAMLARGDSMGVFYVESPAMRLLQKKTGYGDFEHLVIHSSIIRPAANSFIGEYIDRLHGKKYPPLHPLLAGLFDESFGIMCYQEDVCKAAIALADFSPAEADGIRKALSKKDSKERLAHYYGQFHEGAVAKGVDEKTIASVWAMIESFSGYSFVKAHSASYAMLSFKSAYLRCHYPAPFMAAVMSNHGGFYSILAYASEARRMGLRLLCPDVNQSQLRCRGRGREIRFGLEMISSLGAQLAKRIMEERGSRGDFSSIDDFARRVRPGRDEAEALVGSGAVDSLSPELGRAEKLMRLFAQTAQGEGRSGGQGELFASETKTAAPRRSLKEEPERKRMEAQLRYLGTTLEHHPLELWPQLLALKTRTLGCDIPRHIGERIQLVGWPITAKGVQSSQDEPMEFISFEDETALYETVLFPEAYELYRHLLFEERPLIVQGLVEDDRGGITVTISSLSKAGESDRQGAGRGWQGPGGGRQAR